MRPGCLDEARLEEAVGLHEENRLGVDGAHGEVHGAAVGVALGEAHAAHAELLRDLGGVVVGGVVEHDDLDVLLGEGGGERVAQELALVGGDDGDADLHGYGQPMSTSSVCAIVAEPESGAGSTTTVGALQRQTRQPDRIVIAAPGQPAGVGLLGQESWLWLLDGGVSPQPDALERVLGVAAGSSQLPAPALLASKVVLPDGSLDSLSLPTAQVRDPDLAVAAVEHRLLSLRVARRGSLLVMRSALEAVTSRRPHLDVLADDLEWTARLLGEHQGFLVPASVAVRETGTGRTRGALAGRELLGRGRLLLGDAIERGDKPWFAFRFLEEALAELSGVRRYRNRAPWLRRAKRRSTPS